MQKILSKDLFWIFDLVFPTASIIDQIVYLQFDHHKKVKRN